MKITLLTTIIFSSLLVGFNCFAQAVENKPVLVSEYVIWPNSPDYSKDLMARGIQGTVLIQANVDKEGKLHASSIAKSSGSSELDSAALQILNKLKFRPSTEGVEQRQLVIPIVYSKDTIDSVTTKLCSDLLIDYDFYINTAKQTKASKMEAFKYAYVYVVGPDLKGLSNISIVKNRVPAAESTIAECKSRPDEKFLPIFMKQFNK